MVICFPGNWQTGPLYADIIGDIIWIINYPLLTGNLPAGQTWCRATLSYCSTWFLESSFRTSTMMHILVSEANA